MAPDAPLGAVDFDAPSIKALALVADQIGRSGFDRQLLDWLRGLAPFDSALVLIYAERQRPKILVDALDNPDRRNTVQLYSSQGERQRGRSARRCVGHRQRGGRVRWSAPG
jgi:hypothetical protein